MLWRGRSGGLVGGSELGLGSSLSRSFTIYRKTRESNTPLYTQAGYERD
jgi:hypothetical protein